jgi:hypothetical protein
MRALIAPLAVLALGGAIGCGEEETVSDGEIIDALKLERAEDRPVYAIGGDPFCEVEEELLNDATEVDEAREQSELELVITDRAETVGVQGVPPFDPSCERDTRRALDRISEAD